MTQPARYRPPSAQAVITLKDMLLRSKRGGLHDHQYDLLRGNTSPNSADVLIFYAGDLTILECKAVSIVGTRNVSEAGRLRASRLSRELAEAGISILSGLAKGVDTAALTSVTKYGGRAAAVIGTPLSKAYPAENARLQEEIWKNHLLLTPFVEGEQVFRSNFPKRNRVMAAISDATVIVEASDTSGTLHQAAECQRLGRWLFIMKSVVENKDLTWPASFLGKPRTAVLGDTSEVLSAIGL